MRDILKYKRKKGGDVLKILVNEHKAHVVLSETYARKKSTSKNRQKYPY